MTAPSELAGKSLSYVVDELTDWNKNLRFQIQNITLFATQIGTCPSILLPSSETPSDVPTESGKLPVEPMKLTSIGEGENLDGILALAMQMGIDEDALKELMSGGLPNRTPGPISSTTYPGEVPTPKPRFCPRRSSTPVNPPVRPPPQQAPYPHPYYSTIQSTAPSSGNNVHPYHVYSTSNIYGWISLWNHFAIEYSMKSDLNIWLYYNLAILALFICPENVILLDLSKRWILDFHWIVFTVDTMVLLRIINLLIFFFCFKT